MVERHRDNPLHRIEVCGLDRLSLGALTVILALEWSLLRGYHPQIPWTPNPARPSSW
jgi:hypothetical protein